MQRETNERIKRILIDLREARRSVEVFNEQVKNLNEELATLMAEAQQKTVEVEVDDRIYRGTYTTRTTTVIDEEKLKIALGDRWGSYTTAKVNRQALEAALTTRELDPMEIAHCISEKVSEPSIRFTERKKDDEDQSVIGSPAGVGGSGDALHTH